MSAPRRKQKARQITGWLCLDKPYGMSSSQAVAKVKYLFNAAKAGHAGTLDPLATGMLPIALGEATKLIPYIIEDKKYYNFQASWGQARTTDDLEGEISHSSNLRPSPEQIQNILSQYIGNISQAPPQFSAIKCAGQRAYALARQGQAVELAERKIIIDSLDLIEHADDNSSSRFSIICGKGTYIRSIARDMGQALGCYGYVSQLRRTRVQPFNEADMIGLDRVEALAKHGLFELDKGLINSTRLLNDYSQYKIEPSQALALSHGRAIRLPQAPSDVAAPIVCIIYQDQLLAMGSLAHQLFYPKRVFKS